MAVKASFYVDEITEYARFDQTHVKLTASTKGNDRNKDWAKWTPSGTLELYVSNPDAADWFRAHLGQDVSLTFNEHDD